MMKHAYIPRTTNYTLNPGDELNDLRMSDQVRPLYDHVRKFIRDTVEPMSIEFAKAGEGKAGPLELYAEAARGARRWPRTRPRRKASGTSSCPMTRPARA